MNHYQRFIPMLAVIGSAAVASVFAVFMVERLRQQRCQRLSANLEKWEGEGGSSAPLDTPFPGT